MALLNELVNSINAIVWGVPMIVLSLDFARLVADTLNALMATPSLISLLLLSPVVVVLTREYFDRALDERGGHGGREDERPPAATGRPRH